MPARKRHDPAQRPTPIDGGEITDDMTAGKDPDRHYVYVNPVPLQGQGDQVAFYENRGYVQEEYRADGPRPLSVSKRQIQDGKPITSVGLVLMSCPRSEYDAGMGRRLEHCRQMDRRMLRQGGLDDGFRGGNGFSVTAAAGRDVDVNARLGDFDHG